MQVNDIVAWVGILYTGISYSFDLFFALAGFITIKRQKKRETSRQIQDSSYPTLDILVPCYNEKKSLPQSLKYLKQIQYPRLRVIIVNDGSIDDSLEILQKELGLTSYLVEYKPLIPTQKVNDIYISSCNRFIVVDKVNGGKADSLNTAINLSNSELVCCVDADTIIKEDALKKLVKPFLHNREVVASGGNVRIKNGSEQSTAFPTRLKAPAKLFVKLQVIEYVRSINIARNALAVFNANLIISGAFGIFKTAILKHIGGYEKFSKGEDFELVTRIHFYMRQKKEPYKIAQVYLADAFTDGPESIKELVSQRKRWQVGLVSTLRAHIFKFFKFPLSPITLFSLPYFTLFEIISPLVQLFSYAAIPVFALFKLIDPRYFFYLLILTAYNSLVNIFFLAVDFHFSSFYARRDKFALLTASLLDPFFYHQLNCWWKLLGTVDYLRKTTIRAAWNPPRGDRDFKSRLGEITGTPNTDEQKRLLMTTDYKSLYRDAIVIVSLADAFESDDVRDFNSLVDYFGKKKRTRFIFEMRKLKNISPQALANLVQVSGQLKKRGGGLVVLNPSRRLEDQFKISNVIKDVRIAKNYSDAIKELKYG
jgi:biofilm PGA synthesis N-glycosyltransferase PgaC